MSRQKVIWICRAAILAVGICLIAWHGYGLKYTWGVKGKTAAQIVERLGKPWFDGRVRWKEPGRGVIDSSRETFELHYFSCVGAHFRIRFEHGMAAGGEHCRPRPDGTVDVVIVE